MKCGLIEPQADAITILRNVGKKLPVGSTYTSQITCNFSDTVVITLNLSVKMCI